MGYSNEELFGDVKPGSKKEYALKQQYQHCVECGWTDKSDFQDAEEIICTPCYHEKLERMD
ncbi:hypothetical protein ACWZQY_004125 [Priestia megaterium]|jgi:hypothetical protein